MSLTSRLRPVGLLALFLVAASPSLRADEGFWPFNAVPKGAIKQAHGFDVTDGWLRHLQLASVHFGGASGSFISPGGLVLTNHHVGLSTISKLSTPQRDLVKSGFYARTLAEELKSPDLELRVLQSIEDVTGRVNAAVTAGLSKAEAFAARRAAIVQIERESSEATGLQSDVSRSTRAASTTCTATGSTPTCAWSSARRCEWARSPPLRACPCRKSP